MYEAFGWNADNMLFLTRDYPIEPITDASRLKHYADQVLSPSDVRLPEDKLDRFGRNYLDRMFIALCMNLDVLVVCHDIAFRSLACEREGDRYIMHLRYDDEDLEMELVEMVDFFRKKHEETR